MEEEKTKPSPAVLVVDDSSFLRKRVKQALQDSGYDLTEAASGRAALDALDQRQFHCVVTDLVMPELDGFGFLEEIRRRNLQVPVIVLTADIQKSTRLRCEELGAAAFIQKPVNPAELRSALATVLNGRSRDVSL